MVNDAARMRSKIPRLICENKRIAIAAATLSGLIFCVLCPTSLNAAAEAAHKTDAELAQALIGTWEILPTTRVFSEKVITYKADGTSKAIRITSDHGSRRRNENEGPWRVKHGYLIREIMKTTPANLFHTPVNIRCQIESIENGTVKLRYENGDKDELRRINHLPSLPPLLTSKGLVSAANLKNMAISTPQPDYPIIARQDRIQGSGVFIIFLTEAGEVASVEIVKSTGSSILDEAAEKALRKWRFKSGIATGQAVTVPINFALSTRR
jgi:TonB family protein